MSSLWVSALSLVVLLPGSGGGGGGTRFMHG